MAIDDQLWRGQNLNLRLRGRPRLRKRYYFTYARAFSMHVNKAPYMYGQAGTRFLTPSNLTWVPQNPLIRRKLKPRKRGFWTYLLGKNKSQLWKVTPWNRDQPQPEGKAGGYGPMWVTKPTHYKFRGKSKRVRFFSVWRALKLKPEWQKVAGQQIKVPLLGQGIPWGDQQRANYKFRGKSKRKRFFCVWRDNKQARPQIPHSYGQAGIRFLTPSNLTWAPQNPLIRRKLKPRKRFYLAMRDSKQNHRRVPHIIFTPRPPSNLTWRRQVNIVLRKGQRPRKRFFVDIKKMPKAKPPHAYAMGGQFRPSNLSWIQKNPIIKGRWRPRARFKIKGRWPYMASKMHIISYSVLPVTFYYPIGPGKTRTRLAKPSLDESGRGAAPRLQK